MAMAMAMARRHAITLLLLLALAGGLRAQPFDYPSAKPSTTWANTDASLPHHLTYTDGSVARAALLRLNPAGFGPSFAFGFFCTTNLRRSTTTAPSCADFLLGVAVVYSNSGGLMTSLTAGIPQVVWSANRGRPVGEGATVQFTPGGDLVLRAANGAVVWSAGTASVDAGSRLSINSDGNLVLYDRTSNNRPVWQSFDHPTDTLLIGQSLKQGTRLTANSSRLYLTVTDESLSAYVDAKPPQRYYHLSFISKTAGAYASYANGSLTAFARPGEALATIQLPTVVSAGTTTVQYMRLEHDGHLRLYEWQPSAGWAPVFDVLRLFPADDDACAFPTVCGAYGVCTDDAQCSCPDAANFRPVDFRRPNRGCVPVKGTVVSCSARRRPNHQLQQLVSLQNTTYFNDAGTSMRALERVSEDVCRKACLDDCACVAAQFVYGADARDGFCSLQSELFSIKTSQPELLHYNSTVHIKVVKSAV